MELLLSFPITTSASVFAFLVSLYFLFFWIPKFSQKNNKQYKIAPQVARPWPIIGHLHLLASRQPPHITLGSLADKYGPIFSIKLGEHKSLVVSDSEMAKECFTTNDKVFATRPKSLAVELMGYNYATFGIGPYGSYWRQVRKIVMLEFLSNSRLDTLAHIRVSEIKSSIKDVHEFWLKNKSSSNMVIVEMKDWFANLIFNMVVRMLVGKKYLPEDEEWVRFHKSVKTFIQLLGTFVVSDAIPYLRWFDLGGYEKEMRKTAKEMDDILELWLKEHKAKRNSGLVKGEQENFMDAMLSRVDGAWAEDFSSFDADTINKATCLAVLSGATDTTTVTLTWALSLLLNDRHALKKVQDELDIHVGRERQVEDSDIKNLVYLQAIIKETLRLYPAGPLGLPHEAVDDCVVGGYNVPKGTRLFVNLWKIHRDPQVWSDPSEFQPERFLTRHKDVDVRGQHFELIPFGSGRRMCPGISFGLQVLQLTLANLIHGFEFVTPSNEPIDMSESIGLTNVKATPLEVMLSPRLSPNLYA